MSQAPTMFNPAAFAGTATEASAKTKEVEKKPYKTTGISSRDSVRKMLFEAFTAEGTSNEEAATACEKIEDAITAGIIDPKSRQYREKARQIQLKLKG